MLRMIESCFNLAWVVNECFLTLPLSFMQMWSSTPWSFHLLPTFVTVSLQQKAGNFCWDSEILQRAPLDTIIRIQAEPNYLYVSQSVGWLTSLLKLDKSRDISCSGWDIVLKFFGDIPGMFIHYFQIIINFVYVCQSVSWLTSLLKLDKYRDISCSWWYIFLIFWRHSCDVCTLFPNSYKFLVCLSVH